MKSRNFVAGVAAIFGLVLVTPLVAKDYSGGIPEADALLTHNPQIDPEIANEFYLESVRLWGVVESISENCSRGRSESCNLLMGAWLNNKYDLLADIESAANGTYDPDPRVKDARCAVHYREDGPRKFESMGVKCDGPYRVD